MDYKSAGVDTHKAAEYITRLKTAITGTHQNNPAGSVQGSFGGFAGAFRPHSSGLDIVATTDGVGTKIELYREYGEALGAFHGIGQDLVAMCVNDLYCVGAQPAFFLDYIACGRLDYSWYGPVVESIAAACKATGMALLGGETAEHPGVMPDSQFDLAGFCVGLVEPSRRLPRTSDIAAGDVLVGLPSSGLHSNGYSLIRKLLKEHPSLGPGTTNSLPGILEPTRLYTNIPDIIRELPIKAIAHITGGGLYENVPRVLPGGIRAVLDDVVAMQLPVHKRLLEYVPARAAYETFNMGVGIVMVTDRQTAPRIQEFDPGARNIGYLETGDGVVLPELESSAR